MYVCVYVYVRLSYQTTSCESSAESKRILSKEMRFLQTSLDSRVTPHSHSPSSDFPPNYSVRNVMLVSFEEHQDQALKLPYVPKFTAHSKCWLNPSEVCRYNKQARPP